MARETVRSNVSDLNKAKVVLMLNKLEEEATLTDWETGFVSDMHEWFVMKQLDLTPKQFERLERIYSKYA